MGMETEALRQRLNGISFMAMTPFNDDGSVDYEGFRGNVREMVKRVKEARCTITPCGSNGEFSLLSTEEQKKVISICVDEVAGAVPVIAGTGRAGTYETLALSKYAEEVGADGVQVILPYYFVPTEEGMLEHYKRVADAVNIGVVVYNNPAFSGSWIKPPLMKKIIDAAQGKIVAVKENTPHLMLFNGMAKALKGTGVKLLSGFGEQWYAYQFPWGADGFATPFGNFFPEYPIGMLEASRKFDFDAMRLWLDRMQPYYEFVGRCSAKRPDTGMMVKPGGSIYGEGNVRFSVLKAAMTIAGLRGGHMRLPLTDITQAECDELKGVMKSIGII